MRVFINFILANFLYKIQKTLSQNFGQFNILVALFEWQNRLCAYKNLNFICSTLERDFPFFTTDIASHYCSLRQGVLTIPDPTKCHYEIKFNDRFFLN